MLFQSLTACANFVVVSSCVCRPPPPTHAQEHPGIVGYIESFVDRASMDLCIVMAWCSGGDLSSLIKLQSQAKAKRLTEPEIKYLFVQMALALHFMHASNILHRDLKTGNIFLTGGHVVLGDLGISKVLNGAQDLAQTCIGTPYVSDRTERGCD